MVKTIFQATERSLRFIAILWWVFLIDSILRHVFGVSLCNLGLAPRTLHGLVGIFAMPFLHGSFMHILLNSLSLLATLTMLYLELKPKQVNVAILKIILSSGILLWLFGRAEGLHIGASALAYGLTTYIVVIGFTQHKPALIAYSLAMIFFSGWSFIGGIIPADPRISWDGHLMGAIAGIIVASSEIKGKEEPQTD